MTNGKSNDTPALPEKTPVRKAVDQVVQKAGTDDVMANTTRSLLASSYREYGSLSFQCDNLREKLREVEKRKEEVRQHVAALETALETAERQRQGRPS